MILKIKTKLLKVLINQSNSLKPTKIFFELTIKTLLLILKLTNLKSKLNYQFNYGTDFQITNLADLPFEADTYQLDITAGDNQNILTGQKSLHIELIINTPKNNLPLILGLGIPFGLIGLGLIIVFAVARFKTRKIL